MEKKILDTWERENQLRKRYKHVGERISSEKDIVGVYSPPSHIGGLQSEWNQKEKLYFQNI